MTLEVTKHFKDRCKSRLGISKKDAIKYFNRAFAYGLRKSDFQHNRLFLSYLRHLMDGGEGIDCIVYNHYIIIMKKKFNGNYVAITILHVPPEYLNIVDMTKERKIRNAKRKRNFPKRYSERKASEC